MNPYEKRIIYEKAIRYYGEERQLAKATAENQENLQSEQILLPRLHLP